jgi:flavin reductase (DIM6/NTAB) family NADH-FMN oxidoreductase RutF
MSIDRLAFRDSLGCFVTGVTIVTTLGADGEHVGLTVNSFNSVSLEPPMVLFSLDRGAHSLPVFETSGAFAVSVLSDAHEALSNRFARRDADKWDGVACRIGTTGCRLLGGAMATFECTTYARYDGGDHVIFVGTVIAMKFDPGAKPLVYYRGAYNRLSAVA